MPASPSGLVGAHTSASSAVPDSNRLVQEDASFASDRTSASESLLEVNTSNGTAFNLRKRREKDRARNSSRRRKGHYKKLLWFKQPFPDNYTDVETFLDHMKLNPRLQPYEFWSLMADSTVIVQHLASVAIFCCCFVAIIQERVSPVSVVSWASLCTVLGWVLWDMWMGQEEAESARAGSRTDNSTSTEGGSSKGSDSQMKEAQGLGLTFSDGHKPQSAHYRNASISSITSDTSNKSKNDQPTNSSISAAPGSFSSYANPTSSLSHRNQQRLATLKSALLIYAALLGLSPILKSLTKSTTSDSIWAISTSLLCMNVAFFDYGGGTSSHLPASISTNSALMASTVLASRLPSTTHVFSLTLFSIEVFGLFPIFRRHLRSMSWMGHITLTIVLIVSACGGVFVTLTGGGRGAWLAGVILGGMVTFLAMGVCSWWLIGLQKYKNEIHGPWDPARPIIRGQWD